MKRKTSFFKCMLYAIMAVGIVSFTSCDKDDDDNGPGSSADFIGTWVLVAEKGYETFNDQTKEYDEEYDLIDVEDAITFLEDGTCYDLSGLSGTWSYSGGTLTTQFEGESISKTKVITLNSTTLAIQGKGSFEEEGYSYKFEMEYTYTKVS